MVHSRTPLSLVHPDRICQSETVAGKGIKKMKKDEKLVEKSLALMDSGFN